MTANSNAYFLDSNIWLYALLNQQNPTLDEKKRDVAIDLIDTENVVISSQVINEVCLNLIKKAAFSEEQIRQLISSFYTGCRVISLDSIAIIKASDLRTRYKTSFWDSLIVSTALQAKVAILYSEDMQNGLIIEQFLRIVNPFC